MDKDGQTNDDPEKDLNTRQQVESARVTHVSVSYDHSAAEPPGRRLSNPLPAQPRFVVELPTWPLTLPSPPIRLGFARCARSESPTNSVFVSASVAPHLESPPPSPE